MKQMKYAIAKFETQIPANDDIVEIELRQLSKLAEKMKWIQRFCRAYKGSLLEINSRMFGLESSFLVACRGQTELGYVRIVRKDNFIRTNEAVYSISEIYVKPAYRHQRLAEQIIRMCLQNHNVQMIHIEKKNIKANIFYFKNLGFEGFLHQQYDLGYLIHKSVMSKFATESDMLAA